MIWMFVSIFLFAIVITLGYVCYRLSKKLFQFDDLFDMLVDEIDVNVRFFEKLLRTPLFLNSPEVQEANKNMSTMKVRLEEYVNQIEDLTGKQRKSPRNPAIPSTGG